MTEHTPGPETDETPDRTSDQRSSRPSYGQMRKDRIDAGLPTWGSCLNCQSKDARLFCTQERGCGGRDGRSR